MIKLLTIIGARPQIIKAAAISRAIKNNFSDKIEEIIVHTGQHYDQNMSDVFFEELGIPRPNFNLNVGSGRHGVQTAKMIEGIEELLLQEQPNFIILYGDTNSTLAGAIAASKIGVPIVHIEAGLRSFNRSMPEEINRVVCDHLSTMLFSPTKTGYDNLLKEGFDSNNKPSFSAENPGIFHCGDIMYDNSLYFSEIADKKSNVLSESGLIENNFILATVHRDHNTDNITNLKSIFNALIDISKNIKVVLPLHPRTKNILAGEENIELLTGINNSNIQIIPPVSFLEMISLEKNSKMIITDSGGVQKEAYFFKKPCIILRPETEWVEIVDTGNAKIVGADYKKIIDAFNYYEGIKQFKFPEVFGDGKAAEFILNKIVCNRY